MIALVGAMFVALGSAKAQNPYVSLNLLVDFPQDSDDTIAAGTSTQVRLRLSATDLSSRLVAEKDATVGDFSELKYTFSYTEASAVTYVRASDGLILKINDEAGVVLAGATASAAILTAAPDEAVLTPASTAAERASASTVTISESTLSAIVPAGVDDDSAVISAAVVAGVTIKYKAYVAETDDDQADAETDVNDEVKEGEETSIFIPLNDGGDDDPSNDAIAGLTSENATRSGSATLNIGTVDEVDSISFGLSTPKRGSTDPGTTEPAFVSIAGGTTEFTLHVFNANEKPSQSNSISSIVVSTTAGTMSSGNAETTALAGEGQCGGSSTTCELEPPRTQVSPLPKAGLRFLLGAPSRTGTADIRVVVISRAGNVLIDDEQVVTFHGPAAMLEAGEASGTVLGHDVVGDTNSGGDKKAGQDGDTSNDPENPNGDADSGANTRDQITFSVKAVDKGGTTVVTPKLSAKITGPNGKAVSSDKFDTTQSGDLNNVVLLDIDVAKSKALEVGAHTIKFSAGSLSGTSAFTVVGTADTVEIMADDATEEGVISVSVTVTDADGEPVADGTTVTIEAADLRGDGDRVIHLTSADANTKDGVANATFIEIGPGRAAIIAMADGETAVARVTSEYGAEEPEAMPEEEAGLSCLSSLSGFSTWTCDVEASASEIFDWISSRGATALHLNSNRMWVRYSVVDGAMVPGSSDFMVTKSDILYISN